MTDKISISHAKIGLLNTGDMKDIKNISINISQIEHAGDIQIAEALRHLAESIEANTDISKQQRSELLDMLSEISKQAVLAPDQRSAGAVLKSIINTMGAAMGTIGSLAEVWSTWGDTISRFFGI